MTRTDALCLCALLAALLVPAWPLLGAPGAYLADPLSELPVRLWCHERIPLFGGFVDAAAFPNVGPLNDPDPLGSVFTGLLRPLFGRAWAFDAYVLGQIALNLVTFWMLGRELVGDSRAAVFGAVTFALTPLSLVYGVSGAVVDLLTLWPWALATRALVRAWRAPGWGSPLLAGLWAGVGFVASPYLVLVFAALGVPAVAWLVLVRGTGVLPTEDLPRPGVRRLVVIGALAALGGLLVAGPYVVQMRAVMSAPGSQMSDLAVAATRHTAPFPLLAPTHTHRYTAFLADYVAVGKGALIERVAASRFLRAFSPGLVLFAVAAAGLVLSRRRRAIGLWLFVAGFAALASTGPFLPVTGAWTLSIPVNPAWWALRLLPGGELLLEPFRYGLVVAFALSAAGTIGAFELARRFGGWVPFVAAAAWIAELGWVSPVPLPLPVSTLELPGIYENIAGMIPRGALLELPFFDRGTDRFQRVHFYAQLVHGRPIADEVLGFPPRYLVLNQYTASLLSIEKPTGPLGVDVPEPGRVEADRLKLVRDGYAAVLLDPSGYPTTAAADRARAVLSAFGAPRVVDGRELWILAR